MDSAGLNELLNMLLNIFLVSVPEQIFYVALSLILLGKYDLLKINKINMIKMFIPIILPTAILSNVLRTYFEFTMDYMPAIGIIVTSLLIMITYNIWLFKEMIKIFVSVILSFIVVGIIQFSYMPLGIISTGKDISYFNEAGITVFIWTLPERVIESVILIYILVKKQSLLKINTLKTLIQNKTLTVITICILSLNIAFLALMFKLIGFDKILINLTFLIQILIIVMIIIFPIINIAMLWTVVYNITSKEAFDRMLSKERLKTLTSILDSYKKSGQYDKVDIVLHDINKHVNQLYQEK